MKMCICKYELESLDSVIEVPEGMKPLSVADENQEGRVFVYAIVNLGAPLISRRFRVCETSDYVNVDKRDQFLGTVISNNPHEKMIWHVFDCGEVDFE